MNGKIRQAGLLLGLCASASLMARAEDLFSTYRTLTPGAGYTLAAKSLTVGDLTLEIEQGSLWPLTAENGKTVGYMFEGVARYTYRSDDPSDLQTMAKNVDLQAKSLGHSDSSIYDKFGLAMLLTTQPFPAEELGPAGSAPISTSARSWFEKRMAKGNIEGVGFEHMAAQILTNGAPGQVAYAEIDGEHADVGYMLDDVRLERELLWVFWQPAGYDYRAQRGLSHQVAERPTASRVAPFSVKNIVWDVTTPDNKSGTITSTLTLQIQRPNQRVLSFVLANNRDPADSTTWTSKVNPLTVTSVVDKAGTALSYSHRYNELMIDLGAEPAVGTELSITVASRAEVFTATNNERGQNYIDLYLFNWYPRPMGLRSERFTFEVTARCKKPFIPVSSGETISAREEGDLNVMTASSTAPVEDFALFMGKYTPVEKTTERGQKIRVFGYGLTNQDGLKELAEMSAVFLRMFEDMLGPYPYKELDIVEIPTGNQFTQFGISPPGLVMLSDVNTKVRAPEVKEVVDSDLVAFWGARQVPQLLAHELAHQWFGNKVWPASEFDNWLAESLAEYQSGIALQYAKIDDQKSGGRTLKGWTALKSDWTGYAPWCETGASIEAANTLRGANAERLRRCLLYQRGPLVVHMLRSWIGDKGYFALMQKLIKDNEYKPIDTDSFARATSQLLKQDMQWFVDDWIKQPGTPEIAIDAKLATGADGKPALICRAVQTDQNHFKRLYVPIVLTYGDGKQEAKMFFINKPVADQSFPLVATPSKIEVDPQKTALMKLK